MQTIAITQYTTLDAERYALLRSIEGDNRMVAHAADGSIWLLAPDVLLRCRPGVCERYPHPGNAGSSWSLDRYGRPWIVADGAAWRLSRAPGFALAGATDWLVARGATQRFVFDVPTWEGYSGAVDIALDGLPAGVTADITPNPVAAGGALAVTLMVAPDAALGHYLLHLTATAADRDATFDITLRLADTVQERYLPLLRR